MANFEVSGVCEGVLINGRYRVVRKIGRGGFARVYLTEDIQNENRECTVKEFISNDANRRVAGIERILNLSYQREIDALSVVNKPELIEYFTIDETKYIAEEYIEGITLAQHLQSGDINHSFTNIEVEELFIIFLKKLKEFHSHNLVHRDISPKNIILLENNIKHPVLIDFGTSKAISSVEQGEQEQGEDIKLTEVLCTPNYLAPERNFQSYRFTDNSPRDINIHNHPRIDIYALGVVFENLLNKITLISDLNQTAYSFLTNKNSPLIEVVKKMKEYDYNKRYQSVDEVLKEIDNINETVIIIQQKLNESQQRLLETQQELNESQQQLLETQQKSKNTKTIAIILSLLTTIIGISFTANILNKNGKTLKKIIARKELHCGINGELPGFSWKTGDKYSGLDVDYCRVIAVSIFGKKISEKIESENLNDYNQIIEIIDEKIKYKKVTPENKFEKLEDGEIDVLFRNTSWTVGRDLSHKIEFGTPVFYDEQVILTKKESKINELADLKDKNLCVAKNTSSVTNIKSYLNQNKIKNKLTVKDDRLSVFYQSFRQDNDCDAITADLSQLQVNFKVMNKNASYILIPLDKSISKEILSPVFAQGDSNWEDIINYSIHATIRAAELGITQRNASQQIDQALSLEEKQLLGVDDTEIDLYIGEALSLDKEFARYIIDIVGNYYEIFDRNLGQYYPDRDSSGDFNLICKYLENNERLRGDKNQLWNCGGILISPPFTVE